MSDSGAMATPAAAPPRRSWRHASLFIGAALVTIVVGLALLSFVWTPHPATELDIPHKLQGPSACPAPRA